MAVDQINVKGVDTENSMEHNSELERDSSDQSTFIDEEKPLPEIGLSSESVSAGEKFGETDRPEETQVVEVEAGPPTQPHPSPIPNGGFDAWLQVAGSFCLFFNTW